jgi:hypothetical protein
MKWNGRSYRPQRPQNPVRKPFDVKEALKPYGEKELPVWNPVVMNVYKEPEVSPQPPTSPTPTPSVTATKTPTPTPTPSSTPVGFDCTWSATSVNWESNVNDWNECQPQPSPSPTPTSTTTPTVTPTNTVTPTITSSPTVTPTITPSSSPIPPSPSVTSTSTPTPTPTPQGVSEAQTYMAAVIAGGGTLDATASGATYQLFYDLFNYGLWSKLYSFYPLLGGNSSGGQAVNGKTPGTRNITWNGGLIFTTNGVNSNGTTGYGDLNSNPNNIGGLNDFHMSFYSRTNQQQGTAEFDMGAYANPNERTQVNSRSTVDDMRGVVNATTQGTFANTDSSGLFTITRRSSTDTEFYRNSTSLGNSSVTSTARPNGDLFLAARNWINAGGLVESPTTRQYAFVTTGNALSDSEVSNLYTAIQNFQTTLGRQV